MNQIPEDLRVELYSLKDEYEFIYLLDVTELVLDTTKLTSGFVVIRPLTRREFNFFSADPYSTMEQASAEIIRRCVIWPYKFDLNQTENNYAFGIDPYISKAILEISGFASEDTLLNGVEFGRRYSVTIEAIITELICKAFPAYTPADIDHMSFNQQIKLVSMAEQMVGFQIPYIEILHPELFDQKAKQERKEKKKLQNIIERVNQENPNPNIPPHAIPPPPPGWKSAGKSPRNRPVQEESIAHTPTAPLSRDQMSSHMKDLNSFLTQPLE